MPPTYLLFSSPPLRHLLRMTLLFEGYPVHDSLDASGVLAVLRDAATVPSLVLFGDYLPHMHVQAFVSHLTHEPSLVLQHRFLFLSTQATFLPATLAAQVQVLAFPVLSLPFVLGQLLATLMALQQQLPAN